MGSYLIKLRGQVDVEELNPMSPHQMEALIEPEKRTGAVGTAEEETSFFTVNTDQSGMIGLLRHLHGLGFEILSVVWQPQ